MVTGTIPGTIPKKSESADFRRFTQIMIILIRENPRKSADYFFIYNLMKIPPASPSLHTNPKRNT